MRLMLLGATGLVGATTLRRLLANDAVDQVVAPTRSALKRHEKLQNPVEADLLDLRRRHEVWQELDAVICALGTTRKKAGSDEAFRTIDRDLPLALARQAKESAVPAFLYVSSVGADPSSRFLYPRTKGEMELGLEQLAFSSLAILRPSFIMGDRQESRAFEKLALHALEFFEPIIPAIYKPNSAESIAAVLEAKALAPVSGHAVIDSKEIRKLGGK